MRPMSFARQSPPSAFRPKISTTPSCSRKAAGGWRPCAADCLPLAADRGVDLGFAIVEPVFVRGEPAMLTVMVRNLIDNAIRHIPKGGRIDIGVYREKALAILQIEDNGPGISEADLVKVFEPFVRGSGVVEEGSGLGLSIV